MRETLNDTLRLVEPGNSKVCTKCKVDKPFSDFSLHTKGKPHLNTRCKKCVAQATADWIKKNPERAKLRRKNYYHANRERMIVKTKEWGKKNRHRVNHSQRERYKNNPNIQRNHVLKSKYGISLAEFNAMLISQNSNCAICGVNQSSLTRTLYVDHCHATGKVRGLLCQKCNVSIGMLGDSVDLVERALIYLREKQ